MLESIMLDRFSTNWVVCISQCMSRHVAVFICFCVKGLHLELVEDLTTEAFLACLQWFVARRRLPKVIYTDNGSNFVGAKRDLAELRDFINSRVSSSQAVANWFSTQGIKLYILPALTKVVAKAALTLYTTHCLCLPLYWFSHTSYSLTNYHLLL